MSFNWRSVRKIITGTLVTAAGILGIEYANLDWWAWFIQAVISGSTVYWTPNGPGTLLSQKPNRPKGAIDPNRTR